MNNAPAFQSMDTKPLTELLFNIGINPKIVVHLPDVIDICSNLPVGSEQPYKDSCAFKFRTTHIKIYVRDILDPQKYFCIGKILNDAKEPVCIDGHWWFLCNASFERDYMYFPFFERYLRFDNMDLAYSFYGEFISQNRRNSGHDWSGIILSPWSDVNLEDNARLVSRVTDLYPFIIRICETNSIQPHDSLYCYTGLATQTQIPVHYEQKIIGHAEGFRLVRIANYSGWRFVLYDYDKSMIPEDLFWKNHLFISDSRATAAACRGLFITRIEINYPPIDFLS